MIWNNAQEIFVNGQPIQAAFCNGVQIWPLAHVVNYRVTFRWEPLEESPFNLAGVSWEGILLTPSDIDGTVSQPNAQYHDSTGWHDLTWQEVSTMINDQTAGIVKVCDTLTFVVNKTSFDHMAFVLGGDSGLPGNFYAIIEEIKSNGQTNIVGQDLFDADWHKTYSVSRS